MNSKYFQKHAWRFRKEKACPARELIYEKIGYIFLPLVLVVMLLLRIEDWCKNER